MSPRLLGRLLRVVSWPYWIEHGVRTALTIVGVALGVMTIVAVGDVSRSILIAYRNTMTSVAGGADLEVEGAGEGVPEEALSTVLTVPGVHDAAGLVEGFLPLADHPDETVYLVGIDFLGSQMWDTQLPRSALDLPDSLEFVARLDSIVVSRMLARRLGLEFGSRVTLVAPAGPRTGIVRGFLDDIPTTRLFDGAVVVMDLPAAQRLLGREARLDRIAIRLTDATSASKVRPALAGVLGAATVVHEPESRGEQAEQILFSLRSMLVVAASLAVIVGALIVYQAVSVSVQQRRRDLALLNAVGIPRSTLTLLTVVETAALAMLGVAIGVYGGTTLAGAAVGTVAAATSEIWTRVDADVVVHSLAGVGVAAGVGMAMALVASWLAARVTFSAPTIEALRPTGIPLEGPPRAGRRLLLATSCAAATWLIVLVPPRHRWLVVAVIILSQLVAYVGAAIVSPVLVARTGATLQQFAKRTRSLLFRMASDALPRVPRRAGMTVAAISAALAMAASVAGFVQSFENAWLSWLQQHFSADLFVGAGARFHLVAGPPMSLDIGAHIGAVPGVARVEGFRVIPAGVHGAQVFLESASLGPPGLPMVEGSWEEARRLLDDGDYALVSDNLAFRLSLHRGDLLHLDTPSGPRDFQIVGTFVDYLGSLDLGSVAVSRSMLSTVWNDSAANLYRVWLRPGEEASVVRRRILATLGSGYYVVTVGQFLESVRAVWARFFVAAWALELVATLVSVIGLINAQLATIIDRTGEIAMLRAIGVSASDVTSGVVIECATLGAIGGGLGLALGTMLSWQFVTVSMRLLTGWRIGFVLPLAPLLGGACLAAALSALAGAVPARAAARVQTHQLSVD